MPRTLTISAAGVAMLLSAVALTSVQRPFVAYTDSAEVGLTRGRVFYDSRAPVLYGSTRPIKQHRHFRSLESPWLPAFIHTRSSPYNRSYTYIAIPLWPFAVGFAAVALVSHRRIPRHACRQCRYDLTGLPQSSPCPECGSPPPS